MEPTLAEIRMFGGNFAPRAWALCDGQLMPINQNQALFSLLGTTYGGDGRTTFGLPDLRGRLAMGQGRGPGLSYRPLGMITGSESEVLSVSEIPTHNHGVATQGHTVAGASTSGSESPSTNTTIPNNNFYANANPSVAIKFKTGSVAATVYNTGGNLGHTNMMPYTAVNYIIATAGLFPSRN